MQKFDRTRGCPKCGCLEGIVRFCEGVPGRSPDRLVRKCAACEHRWDESPLDAPEPKLDVKVSIDASRLSSPEAVRELMALASRYIRTEVHGAKPSKIRD